MRPDRVLIAIAELAESAYRTEDPPAIQAQPPLPLTASSIRDILRQMPDVRPVAALIRSLYPDRKARADLVFALYGMGGQMEERLKLIVDAIDLLRQHVKKAREETTGDVDTVMEDAPLPAYREAATADPAAEPVDGPNTATLTTAIEDKDGPVEKPALRAVPLRVLIPRIVDTDRIETQMLRVFPREGERRRVMVRMKRFGRVSLERWAFLAGLLWCIDVRGSHNTSAQRI